MGQFTISHSDNRDILLLARHHTTALVESSQPHTWTHDRCAVSRNLLFKMFPLFQAIITRPHMVL